MAEAADLAALHGVASGPVGAATMRESASAPSEVATGSLAMRSAVTATMDFLMLSGRGSLRAIPSPSSGRPWIDHLYAGFKEILDVPRGQDGPASPADGCDLGVKTLDREAQAGPPDHHRAEPGRRQGIKWLNELTERGEEIRRDRQQAFFPPPVRETFDAMADLGNGDRRGAELICTQPANPLPHASIGLRPHQLGHHVRVKNYHQRTRLLAARHVAAAGQAQLRQAHRSGP